MSLVVVVLCCRCGDQVVAGTPVADGAGAARAAVGAHGWKVLVGRPRGGGPAPVEDVCPSCPGGVPWEQ